MEIAIDQSFPTLVVRNLFTALVIVFADIEVHMQFVAGISIGNFVRLLHPGSKCC